MLFFVQWRKESCFICKKNHGKQDSLNKIKEVTAMMANEAFSSKDFKSPQDRFKYPLSNFSSMISIYTGLCILHKMRHQLGLEAMMEYMDTYIQAMEEKNPILKAAVGQAVTVVSVERIYDEACRKNKNNDGVF